MKNRILFVLIFICASFLICHARQTSDAAHTPKKGSAERQAILDAIRGGDAAVAYQVNYLRVHNGWAWIDATPLDAKTRQPTAEGGPALLHLENGKWKELDLSQVPADPKDPLGAEDASPGFIRNLRKTYRGVPSDIFPAPGK